MYKSVDIIMGYKCIVFFTCELASSFKIYISAQELVS